MLIERLKNIAVRLRRQRVFSRLETAERKEPILSGNNSGELVALGYGCNGHARVGDWLTAGSVHQTAINLETWVARLLCVRQRGNQQTQARANKILLITDLLSRMD